jgi:signal recognition particle subunit SRP19
MSHPRVEEVEDSDVDMSDPAEEDIDDFDDADIMRRVGGGSSPSLTTQPPGAKSHLINPAHIPSSSSASSLSAGGAAGEMQTTSDPSAYADFQCLYPVYFDASRTRAEGRRVSKELAVTNPLAREIVNACAMLRLQTLFEPGKTHPKDWANPGRVKVKLRYPDGRKPAGMASVKNKHHLYLLVAKHLQQNPTTESSPALRVRVPGMPMPEAGKPWPKPAIPRGWKMGTLLPYMSRAMTGGGVSENLFKDMMKEMQGGGDPMQALMNAAGPSGGGSGGGGPAEEKPGKKKKGKGRT